jgi:hypothetical protein
MQKAIHGITVAHFFEIYRDKLKLERDRAGFRFIDCDAINDYTDVF